MNRLFLTILSGLIPFLSIGQNFPTHQVDSNAHAVFTDLQLVDLDADLDLDIIVAPSSSNSVWWYENQGGGVFSSSQVLASGVYNVNQIECADLDLDGDLDLLVGSSSHWEDIFWIENLGNLAFGTPDTIPTSISGIDEIHVADFNNDTLPDVLVAGWYSNTISMYTNLGNGSFGNELIIDTNLFDDWDLQLFDFNQDGFQDVFFSSDGPDSIKVYECLGNGLFSLPINLGLSVGFGSGERTEFVFLDLDGDNDYEIITNEVGNDCVGYYNNLGGYQFSVPSTLVCNAGDRTFIGVELNGDNLVDIVSYDDQIGKLIWHKNLGNFGFSGDYKITPNLTQGSNLIYGDIDNDGDNDIVSYNDYVSWQQSDPLILWHENRLDEIALEIEDIQQGWVSVFPNPSNGIITIEMAEKVDRIEVFNLSGEIVEKFVINDNLIDLRKLPTGCYFLKLTSVVGDVFTERIVMQ